MLCFVSKNSYFSAANRVFLTKKTKPQNKSIYGKTVTLKLLFFTKKTLKINFN